MNNKRSEVSGAVIRRLPRYYRCLLRLEEQGTVKISSRELARIMDLTASQIRQDLNCFGGFGQQGYGYSVSALKEEIARIDVYKRQSSHPMWRINGMSTW